MPAAKKEPKAYLDEQVTHIHESIRHLAVDVDTLTPYHKNPRRGDIPLIMESLRTNGQYRPIVVNKGTHTGRVNEILGGNHTYAAIKGGGWQFIAVTWVDVDDQRAARIVAVDNASSDKAKNDVAVLVELLGDLDDLTGSGYTDEDLVKMMPKTGDADDLTHLLGDQVFSVIVRCEDEGHQIEVLELLTGQGLDAKAMIQ